MSDSRGTRKPDPAAARIAARIEPVVGAAGYDLEEFVVTPAGRRSVVRVVVDRDTGVSLDDVAEVSRAVSAVLDDDDDLGRSPYVLEVTSPGVDRPLTEPRHWRRNTGRLVAVAVGSDGGAEQLTGRVTAVDEEGVTLAVEARARPGAKKRPPTPRQVPWAALGVGRVQVEFGRAEDHQDGRHQDDHDHDDHDHDDHDDHDHDDHGDEHHGDDGGGE